MKLSEAIRLGAMLKPQARGSIEKHGATCALGAACDAVGIPLADCQATYDQLETRWPFLPTDVLHPRTGRIWEALDVVLDLNDTGWTREQIADWVATIEPQDEPPTQPTHEVTHEVLDEPAHSHHDR